MSNKKQTKENKEILYKVVTFLNRQELDFLDRIVKDIFFATSSKIPRSQIVREIIQMAVNLNTFGKSLLDELTKKGELGNVEKNETEGKSESLIRRRPL